MDEPKIHRLFWRDVHKAHAWYLDRDDLAAARFLDAVWLALEEVLQNPSRWPIAAADYRYRLLRRYPFRVIYRQETDRIHIIALAHLKRKEGYWKRRK